MTFHHKLCCLCVFGEGVSTYSVVNNMILCTCCGNKFVLAAARDIFPEELPEEHQDHDTEDKQDNTTQPILGDSPSPRANLRKQKWISSYPSAEDQQSIPTSTSSEPYSSVSPPTSRFTSFLKSESREDDLEPSLSSEGRVTEHEAYSTFVFPWIKDMFKLSASVQDESKQDMLQICACSKHKHEVCGECHRIMCTNCGNVDYRFSGIIVSPSARLSESVSPSSLCNQCVEVENSKKRFKEIVANADLTVDQKIQVALEQILTLISDHTTDDTHFSTSLDEFGVNMSILLPTEFGAIQRAYGESSRSLIKSICYSGNMRGGPSKGKSGSYFYLTEDKRFVLKSVSRSEWNFLKDGFLKSYRLYVQQNSDTLLPRLFLCFKYSTLTSSTRFIVMNNVFDTNLKVHEIFDIKGSKKGREVSKKELESKGVDNVIWKDLDFERKRYKLHVPQTFLYLLTIQIQSDLDFLKRNKVIDYSLLLGIHNYLEIPEFAVQSGASGIKASLEFRKQTQVLTGYWEDRLYSHRDPAGSRTIASTIDGEDFRESVEVHAKIRERKSTPRTTPSAHSIPNSNFEIDETKSPFQIENGGVFARDLEGNPLPFHYFFGIIDILQPYNLRKALETQVRSIANDVRDISAVDPELYSARFFQKFCTMFH
jgi:hypothetical protein